MSFRTTYILFGILIAELVAFGLSQVFSNRPGEELYVLPTLNRANLTAVGPTGSAIKGIARDLERVEINRAGEPKIVFTREEGLARHWKLSEPYSAAIESDDRVNAIVDQLVNARKEDKVDTVGTNLSKAGLSPPKVTVTLEKGDGQKWTLNLGEKHDLNGRGLIYVNSSDLPKEVMALREAGLDSLLKTYTVKVRDEKGNPVKIKDAHGEMKEVTRTESRYKNARDFRARDLVTPSDMMVQAVDLSDGKHSLKLKRESDPMHWKFIEPNYGAVEYDAITPPGAIAGPPPVSSMKALLNTLTGLKIAYDPDEEADKKVNDFVAENVPADKLAEYGLEKGKPAYLRIGYERSQGGPLGSDARTSGTLTNALLIGKELPAEKDAKEKWRYARLESENNVVKVPVKNIEQLAKIIEDPSSLRNHDLVQLDPTKVDAIDVKKSGGAHLKLRKVGTTWKLWDAIDKGSAADEPAVTNLLSSLLASPDTVRGRLVESFPKDDAKDADLGLDAKDQSGEITLWEGGIDEDAVGKEDKKDAEPKMKAKPGKVVKLVFGKSMPNNVANVLREADDLKLRLTVAAKVLDRLNDNRLDFIDRKLPTINEHADVTKIVIHQNGKDKDDIELALEKKDDKPVWVLKKPELMAGRNADTNRVKKQIIDTLAFLQTDKFLVEKLGDAKEQEKFVKALESDGLKPAEVQVSITVKKNDKENDEYVYQFGKTADKDEKRYARIETKPPSLAARDVIFLVTPEPVKQLLAAKLLDLTVFDFVPTKINKVKIVGWRKKDEEAKTIEAEREGSEPNKWKVLVAPSKDNFEIDGPKMEVFLTNYLKPLRADDDFLEYKFKDQTLLNKYELGKEKKDDKEVDQFALQITLSFPEDQKKEPLVLTIGKYLEDRKGYAATSSTLPGDIFVLPRTRLPIFKDKDGKEVDLVEGGWKYFNLK